MKISKDDSKPGEICKACNQNYQQSEVLNIQEAGLHHRLQPQFRLGSRPPSSGPDRARLHVAGHRGDHAGALVVAAELCIVGTNHRCGRGRPRQPLPPPPIPNGPMGRGQLPGRNGRVGDGASLVESVNPPGVSIGFQRKGGGSKCAKSKNVGFWGSENLAKPISQQLFQKGRGATTTVGAFARGIVGCKYLWGFSSGGPEVCLCWLGPPWWRDGPTPGTGVPGRASRMAAGSTTCTAARAA